MSRNARGHTLVTVGSPPVLWCICVAFLTFWATLLGHEGAHYLARWWLLSPAEWSRPEPFSWSQIVVWSAGPAASLLIVMGSAAIRSISRRATIQRVALLAGLGAASRIVLIAIPTMLGKSNDEHSISIATGVSARVMWGAEAAVTALLIAWMFVRRAPPSTGAVGGSLFGILLGWFSAFTFGRALGLPI